MKDDPNCPQCNTPETIKHYLLHCARFNIQREKLKQDLRNVDIHVLEVKILLGGGDFTLQKHKTIIKALAKFIKETRRFEST